MAKVLVVDDDPDFIQVASTVLKHAGYQVMTAHSGALALELMRQEVPDVVILDVMLSHLLEGLDVSHQMAADPILQDVPVIVVTSMIGTEESAMLPSDEYIPVDAWLAKPVDPQTLIERVQQVLK